MLLTDSLFVEDDKSEEFGWSDGSEETSSLPGDFVSVLRGDSVRKTQSEPPSPSPRKCRKTSQSNWYFFVVTLWYFHCRI